MLDRPSRLFVRTSHLQSTALTLLVVLAGGSTSVIHAAEGEFSASGFHALRIENEIKLAVPRDETEAVWRHLTERYQASPDMFLEAIDDGFTTAFSEESFVDRYFDDADLGLLKRECGIRHRTRSIDSDPSHRKHGRQLVQLKLRRDGDQALNRSEIKFPVETRPPGRDLHDLHPLIGLVERKFRPEFLEAVAEIGLDATTMRNTVTIEQRRRRVYISLDREPFATITLDEVTSSIWWSDLAFTEVEMELNEIAYTEAAPEQRAVMERINEEMKQDLLAAFPRIVQDQTPKYNKVFDHFDAEYTAFPLALSLGSPLEPWLAALPVASIAGAVHLLRRRRQAGSRLR